MVYCSSPFYTTYSILHSTHYVCIQLLKANVLFKPFGFNGLLSLLLPKGETTMTPAVTAEPEQSTTQTVTAEPETTSTQPDDAAEMATEPSILAMSMYFTTNAYLMVLLRKMV